MVGIVSLITTTYHCNGTCHSYNLETSSLILDSRATNHMNFDIHALHDLILLERPILVSLSNGYKVQVTHHGKLRIDNGLILDCVLLVPNFKYNLMSVKRVASQLHCQVVFS